MTNNSSDKYYETANNITDEWFEYLRGVNRLSEEIWNLNFIHWDKLNYLIAEAIKKEVEAQ